MATKTMRRRPGQPGARETRPRDLARGQRIKALIDALGLSQSGFAQALRMKDGSINRWVQGLQEPRKSNLGLVADAFSYDRAALVSYVAEGGPVPMPVQTEAIQMISRQQPARSCEVIAEFAVWCQQRDEPIGEAFASALHQYIQARSREQPQRPASGGVAAAGRRTPL